MCLTVLTTFPTSHIDQKWVKIGHAKNYYHSNDWLENYDRHITGYKNKATNGKLEYDYYKIISWWNWR